MSLLRAITVTVSDPWVRSFDIWGRIGIKPICAGDGTYIGNATVEADDATVIYQWTAPVDADWQVIAIPLRDDFTGRPAGVPL